MTSTGEDASVSTTRTEAIRFRLSAEEKAFLERVAAEDDRSVSAIVRLALKQFAEQRGER